MLAKCLYCMTESHTASMRGTHILTSKLPVSATWWDLGRRCFTLADWKDPQEGTEGREPVGRKKAQKNPSVLDSNYYRSPAPGLLFSNHTLKQQTGEEKNSEWFISGASWDLHRQDLAAAQSEMRKRHPDLRETDPSPLKFVSVYLSTSLWCT